MGSTSLIGLLLSPAHDDLAQQHQKPSPPACYHARAAERHPDKLGPIERPRWEDQQFRSYLSFFPLGFFRSDKGLLVLHEHTAPIDHFVHDRFLADVIIRTMHRV